MEKNKLQQGQTVYLKPISASRRPGSGSGIREVVVQSVGRKYFTVENFGRFHLDTFMQACQYNASYKAYLTLQSIREEMELNDLKSKLRRFFDWNPRITLDEARKIATIINLPEDPIIPQG